MGTLPTAPTKTGYTFTGWNTQADGSGTAFTAETAVTGNITVYAQWQINAYEVTFSAGANGTLTATVDGNPINSGALIEHGKNIIFTAGPNAGHRVKKWTRDGSAVAVETGNEYTITNLQGPVTVTVVFEEIPTMYTVTYDGNGFLADNVPTDENTYEEGESVTVLDYTGELTMPGYAFAGWNAAADGSGTAYTAGDTFEMGTDDVTLYAQLTIDDFECTSKAENSTTLHPYSATFTWSPAIGARGIKIQQSTDEGSNWSDAVHDELSPEDTTAEVTGLLADTVYQFKLVVDGGVTAGESNQIEVTTKDDVIFGASWNSSTGGTTMTRRGDAEEAQDLTTMSQIDAFFDNYAPWSGIKLCTVTNTGTITYLDDFEDPDDFDRSGDSGQVMVEIPKFYYKHTYNDNVHEFWVADWEADGFELHPAFMRNGQGKEAIYIGAYKAGLIVEGGKTKLTSVTGAIPAVNENIATFRDYADNRGAGWTQGDILTRSAVTLLYLVEYANMNSQNAIGRGIESLGEDNNKGIIEGFSISGESGNNIIVSSDTASRFRKNEIVDVGAQHRNRGLNEENVIGKDRMITDISGPDENSKVTITVDGALLEPTEGTTYYIYHVAQRTGGCDSLNGRSGMAEKNPDKETDGEIGRVSVSYRGIEDLWGNIWEFVDGIYFEGGSKKPSIADHGFGTTSNYSEVTELELPAGSHYITNLSCPSSAPWLLLPLTIGGGASNKYVPDYFYQAWGGNDMCLRVGGQWYVGVPAGLFETSVDLQVEDTNMVKDRNIETGTRLQYIP